MERQGEVSSEEQENTGSQGNVSLTNFRDKRDAPINVVNDWLMTQLVGKLSPNPWFEGRWQGLACYSISFHRMGYDPCSLIQCACG